MPSTRHLFASLFLASALLDAQRIYVVDQTGGIGTDFTELPAAVNAAQDGDVLRVRRGAYMLRPRSARASRSWARTSRCWSAPGSIRSPR